jgi:hypothetical protein
VNDYIRSKNNEAENLNNEAENLAPPPYLKEGDRVETTDGMGTIAYREFRFLDGDERYAVQLDNPERYSYSPAFYWASEFI